jgi:hypothetical protein
MEILKDFSKKYKVTLDVVKGIIEQTNNRRQRTDEIIKKWTQTL